MDLDVETRIPDLDNLALAGMGSFEEARLIAGLLGDTTVPAARFQSSI